MKCWKGKNIFYFIIKYFSGYVLVTDLNIWDLNIFNDQKLILCSTDCKTIFVLVHR